MSDNLYIWLPADLSEPWHWKAFEDHGLAVDDGDKAALSGKGARNINVILPGQQTRMFAHELPKMREADKLAAAGFSIEDKIAAPLTDQHLVLGAGDDKRVAVVSQNIMEATIQELTRLGLRSAKVYADFDALPNSPGSILLADRFIQPGPLGYSLDREWAKTDIEERPTHQVLNQVNVEKAINLRTGHYAPKAQMVIGLRQIIRAAALLAVTGIVWLGFLGVQNRATLNHAEFIKSETARMFTEFTGQSAPPNPALFVMRNVKGQSQEQADFLGLSKTLFQAIEKTDGVSIESLQFDETQNQLTVRLSYPRFESATELEQYVSSLGGEFQAGGIREQGGQLIGDAVLVGDKRS